MPPVFGPVSPSPMRLWSWEPASGRDRRAVGQRHERELLALEQLLDDDAAAGVAEDARPHHLVERVERLGLGPADEDALPCREAVGLHHARRAGALHVGGCLGVVRERAERGGRHAEPCEQVLRERLRAFELRAGGRGPERAQALVAEAVDDPSVSGFSGPTTVRSIARSFAKRARPARSSAAIGTHSATSAMPALPGAQNTASTCGLLPNRHASACSRPPPPTTRTRIV
jgi:hypothetical protein